MDGPAEDAVGFFAELTEELVDFVLVDAPPPTVGSLTVEAVLGAALCDAQTHIQKPLVLLFCEQRLYLSVQQLAVTVLRTGHLRISIVHYSPFETLPAEDVETLSEHDALLWLQGREADGTLFL